VGSLTRLKLREAFAKKITAQQIMQFLQAHAHPQTLKEPLVAPPTLKQDPKVKPIYEVFGLARDRGLQSVAQQLHVWEQEMNAMQAHKGVLVSFENQHQYEEFRLYKNQHQIQCWLWNEQWKELGKNVAVVDIRFEKETIEFINKCTR
jgi:hypothetical protein